LQSHAAAIARRVTEARERAGMTKTALAETLGLAKQSYAPYEPGVTPFSVDQLFVLSRVLNRSVEWLLGLDTGLTEAEDELLACFRNTDDSGQNAVLSVARSMARERPRPDSGS